MKMNFILLIVAYWSENGDVVIANLKPLFTKI